MDNHIDKLSGHVIICGFGRVGRAAAEQLVATGHDVVVIDRDAGRLAGADLPHLVGEATGNEILRAAGIDRARALVASLDTDAETVYLTLSARALAPHLVIVARARTADSKEKLVARGGQPSRQPADDRWPAARRLRAAARRRGVHGRRRPRRGAGLPDPAGRSCRSGSHVRRPLPGGPGPRRAHRRPAPRPAPARTTAASPSTRRATSVLHAGCVLIALRHPGEHRGAPAARRERVIIGALRPVRVRRTGVPAACYQGRMRWTRGAVVVVLALAGCSASPGEQAPDPGPAAEELADGAGRGRRRVGPLGTPAPRRRQPRATRPSSRAWVR